jgi:hypothetical protein
MSLRQHEIFGGLPYTAPYTVVSGQLFPPILSAIAMLQ